MRRNLAEIKGRVLICTLTLCLTACGATITTKPPAELMYDCDIPPIKARTNGELASTTAALRGALVLCNIDKAALRKWAEGPSP